MLSSKISKIASKAQVIFGPISKKTVLLAGAFMLAWFVLVGKPLLDDIERWTRPYAVCSNEIIGHRALQGSPFKVDYGYGERGSIRVWESSNTGVDYSASQIKEISDNVYELPFTVEMESLKAFSDPSMELNRTVVDFNEPSFTVYGKNNFSRRYTCF